VKEKTASFHEEQHFLYPRRVKLIFHRWRCGRLYCQMPIPIAARERLYHKDMPDQMFTRTTNFFENMVESLADTLSEE
jgi:hypothetical protein